jgi:hypothetical protein
VLAVQPSFAERKRAHSGPVENLLNASFGRLRLGLCCKDVPGSPSWTRSWTLEGINHFANCSALPGRYSNYFSLAIANFHKKVTFVIGSFTQHHDPVVLRQNFVHPFAWARRDGVALLTVSGVSL